MPMRLRLEAVELEVDLAPVAVPFQERQQLVRAGDLDAVRVDENPDDVPLHHLLEQREQLRMHRRLTARDHQDVEPPALPLEPPVDVLEHALHGGDARELWRRVGKARGTAQVALFSDFFQQDAGVLRLHLAEPSEVGGGNRIKVPGRVRRVQLGRRGPLLEVAQDLGGLVVQRDDLPMPGAATYEPDLAVLLGEIAAQALHLGERAVGGFAMALGAEGHHITEDAVGAQPHSGHRHWSLPMTAFTRLATASPTKPTTTKRREIPPSPPDLDGLRLVHCPPETSVSQA